MYDEGGAAGSLLMYCGLEQDVEREGGMALKPDADMLWNWGWYSVCDKWA